ncbi:MFS transporter [Peptoniphilus sp. BV3AC2]|uniref:MFS transporter n=1 Tax=Peptoniphilus sp. BV3AC2 TaxID=1111133 RepID=UPI0003B90008|nr:MFS transporter [Peptoniphilus sp. BV3AC2]ERT64150.1 transporter, major facilitator domain protein [Peptoniphilus sp. BV3AC2]
MNSKIKYYTTMGLYWSVIASCVSFLNVFLTGRGLGTAEIGFLTAVGNGLAAIFQPIVSKVCSRSNKNERDFLVLISMLAMTLVIMALERKAGLAMKIEIVAAIALVLVMQPLLNSLGYFYIARSVEINYGVSRGIGSITFAVTSFVLGILSEINKDLSMVMAAVLLGALILSLLAQKPISGNNLVTVFDGRAQKQKIQNSKFVIFLLAVGMLFTFYNVTNVYLLQIAKRIGGDAKTVGTAFAVAALFEFPIMFMFNRLKEKFKSRSMLIFSGIFFLLKGILTYIATSPSILIAIQVTQLFGFALFTPCSVDFINDIMSDEKKITGQGFLASAITMGGVIGSVAGGVLIESTGVLNTLIISNVICLIAILLIVISTRGCNE